MTPIAVGLLKNFQKLLRGIDRLGVALLPPVNVM